jgi:hypothetical protein
MKAVLDTIVNRRREFERHPFFRRLDGPGTFDAVVEFAPGLTFWVVAFQDVLRYCANAATDPLARKIARHSRAEDRGHDDWFFHDLRLMGVVPDLRWVFGPEHAATRDVGYALMGEALRAEHEFTRIALLIVAETTGQVFFSRIPDFIARTDYRGRLKYLARTHLEAEKAHELWEEEVQHELAGVQLSPYARSEAMAMIDRAFRAFSGLMDHLEERAAGRALTPERRARSAAG